MKWHWSTAELIESWSLTSQELTVAEDFRSTQNRLALIVLLKFFQNEGRFPLTLKDIPADILEYLALQMGVELQEMASYDWTGRTARRQHLAVLAFLGIHRFNSRHRESLKGWLRNDVLPLNLSLNQLQERLAEWFREQHVEPLSPISLERLIRSEVRTYEATLMERITFHLSRATKASLEKLLQSNSEQATSDDSIAIMDVGFHQLKSDTGRTSLKSVLGELAKFNRIRAMGLPQPPWADVPVNYIQKFSQRAVSTPIIDLQRQSPERKYALLSAFCLQRQQEIVDGLIDLLIQVIHKIGTRAESKVEKELLEDFRRVRGKAKVLFRLAEAAIEKPDGKIKEVLYPVVSLETLKELVKEFKASGPQYRKVLHTAIRGSYGNHYRRMLQPLLDALEFRSNNALHRPVIEALAALRKYRDSQQKYFSVDDVPIQGVIRKGWIAIIVETDKYGQERVNRISYELCVLQALRERLRSKEIWVVGAQRYQNPDEDLPQDFDAKRTDYYAALKLPKDADLFIHSLQQEMKVALNAFNTGFPKNSKVKLRPTGKHRIILTPLDAQSEPLNLDRLKAELFSRWHSTSLLDVLKEADLRIGFSEAFHTAGSREVLDRATLQRRLLLCLYGLGTIVNH